MQDQIFELIKKEKQRQIDVLEMIPSENYASEEVMKAVGSVLINKYAEGNPGRRYYQGNEFVDKVELLAERRALEAFGLKEKDWGVNVQAHSGCEANLIVYNAVLEPGDKILSMFLPDGGHLSHGWQLPGKKLTLVSKIYDVSFYKVSEKDQRFDYDKLEKQAKLVKPRMIVSGGTAYAREINHQRMGQIAKSVGAYYLADVSHEAGLIAAGVQESPFDYADVVTCTTHKTLRGPRGALIFAIRNRQDGDLMPLIDFSVIPGVQGGPHIHTIAGIAVALAEAKQPKFKKYATQVIKNAKVFAAEFKKAGFHVVSGGTDKHLVLLDLRSSKIDAWTVTWAMEYANIIVNRNTVPQETASAFYPSGLRMGTPAITTRGLKEKECKQIATWMIEILNYSKKWNSKTKEQRLKNKKLMANDEKLLEIKKKVQKMTSDLPMFTW